MLRRQAWTKRSVTSCASRPVWPGCGALNGYLVSLLSVAGPKESRCPPEMSPLPTSWPGGCCTHDDTMTFFWHRGCHRQLFAAGPTFQGRSTSMPEKSPRLLDVLVAGYDNVAGAEADLKAVRDLYQRLGTSYNFDAAVVSKDQRGRVKINKTFEAGKRHDALKGLGFGLAAGVVAAVFPPIGIGLALGAGALAGTALGAVIGHVQRGIPRDDLRKIADRLDTSEAALVVVYETSLADQVRQNIKAIDRLISGITDLSAEQLSEEIKYARVPEVQEPAMRR